MPRIHIDDLPPLQDLTEEQLKELFGAGRPNVRLSIEALEDRQLMATGLLSGSLTSSVGGSSTSNTSLIYQPIYTPVQVTAPTAVVAVAPTEQVVLSSTVGYSGVFLQESDLNAIVIPGVPTAPVGYSEVYSPGPDLNALVTPIGYSDVGAEKTNPAVYAELISPGGYSDVLLPTFSPELAGSGETDGLHIMTYPSSDQEQGRLAIRAKVIELVDTGARPRLGGLIDAESFATADGYGRYLAIENFSIVWSPQTGARVVDGLILKEYVNQGFTKTLGFPTSDAYPLPGRSDGAYAQYFLNPVSRKGSLIVWSQPTGANTISGPILEKYLSFGAGYGVPLWPEFNRNGVRAQDFRLISGELGTIVWSQPTGANEVAGATRDKWIGMGGLAFGLPQTDSTKVTDLNGRALSRNRSVSFSGGNAGLAAISDGPNGPAAVYGKIYRAWRFHGGVDFGRPDGDERRTGSQGEIQLTDGLNRAFGSDGTVGGKTYIKTLGTAAVQVFARDNGVYSAIIYHFHDDTISVASSDGGYLEYAASDLPLNTPIGNWGSDLLTASTGTSSAPLTVASIPTFPVYQNTAITKTQTSALYGSLLGATTTYQIASDTASTYLGTFGGVGWSDTAQGAGSNVAAVYGGLVDFGQDIFLLDGDLTLDGGIGWRQEVTPAWSDTAWANLSPYAIVGGSDVYSPVLNKNGGFNNPIASYIPLPPVLNSYPQFDQRGQRSSGAAKTIFLDFMGGYLDQGFRYQSAGSETGGTADSILNSGASVNLGNRYVPPFSLDGKLGFSAAEQAVMKEIWQRVAEDFAPFNVNVTTNWEGSLSDRNMLRIVIGGSSVPTAEDMADRYGLSLFDSMKQGGPNLSFVFADSIRGLGGNFATLAANVASREAGHAFGLRYRPLDYAGAEAHIMGKSIGHELSRWSKGTVPVVGGLSSWAEQDDLMSLTGALGLREDDHGDDGGFTNLGNLDATGMLQGQGIIGINLELRAVEPPNYLPTPGSKSYLSTKPHDQDVFEFQTQGGSFYLAMQGVGAGQNLKVQFEIWSSSGEQFGQYVETGALNGALKLENLPAGTYYVVVNGDFGGYGRDYSYGDLGQYNFSIYQYSGYLDNLFSSTWGKSIWLNSASSGDNIQWADNDAVWASYASLFPEELDAGVDNLFPFTPGSPSSVPLPWDAIGAYIDETPANPDIGDWPEYTADQAAGPLLREGLQARLVELDLALQNSQQELLDVQAQYTAERERIDAEIEALGEVTSEETAQVLADLQAGQVAALEQHQQQIAAVQGRIDAISAEQALIGNALAEAAVAGSDQLDQAALATGLELEASALSLCEQLRGRLAELDQLLELSRHELQGALDVHAQYTTERELIDAEIAAFGEVTSEEMAQILADLQASQVNILAALAQNEQQIADLQGRIDTFTAEEAGIGSELTEAVVAGWSELEAAASTERERLEARLMELDPLVEQSRQELLDVQAQYTAESERIEAEIGALGEVTSEEMAQIIADLQASQAAALAQNQQRIADLQGQIDLLSAEQSLLGSQLAAAVAEEQQPVAGDQTQQEQPVVEDQIQQDQGDSAGFGSDNLLQEPDGPMDADSSDSVPQEEPVAAA